MGNPYGNPTTNRDRGAGKLKKEMRRYKIIDLVVKGKTYQEISEELGIRKTSISKIVNGALKSTISVADERVATLRRVYQTRAEKLWNHYVTIAMDQGATEVGIKAGNLCLRILSEQARWVGLDARLAEDRTSGGPQQVLYFGDRKVEFGG